VSLENLQCTSDDVISITTKAAFFPLHSIHRILKLPSNLSGIFPYKTLTLNTLQINTFIYSNLLICGIDEILLSTFTKMNTLNGSPTRHFKRIEDLQRSRIYYSDDTTLISSVNTVPSLIKCSINHSSRIFCCFLIK
jgi:hypothetical protein